MELRHLRYFVAVAEVLSFTQAAGKLRVAQPALSRQIKQLEEEVGVELFVRHRQGVRLSPAGEAFLAEARALLAQSEQAIRRAKEQGSAQPEPLRVGYVFGLFHSAVPTWLKRFRSEHPDMAAHLFDLTAEQQATALERGELDVAFVGFVDEGTRSHLSLERIGSCELVAALPQGHPLAKHRSVPLEALAHEEFVFISEHTYPAAARFVRTACERAGFRPRILQTAERGFTALGMVAGNCGIALLPEPLRELPHAGVVFRQLADPPRADLYMAWIERRPHGVRQAFVDFCRRAHQEAK